MIKLRALILLLCLSGCDKTPEKQTPNEIFKQDPLLDAILQETSKNFIGELDGEKMKVGAINGMLSSLDPYNTYLPASYFEKFKETVMGEYKGIGLEIMRLPDGQIKVIAPYDDSPADKAGIHAGDIITHINGTKLTSHPEMDVLASLTCKTEKDVHLTIARPNKQPFKKKINCSAISVNPVKYKTIDTIGYLRISVFNLNTPQKVREALSKMTEESTPLKGLIIDVRNNPGGSFEVSSEVIGIFLKDSGVTVQVQYKGDEKPRQHVSGPTSADKKYVNSVPIMVLVNNGSASASEILAGALQDHNRALIVGTKTFGKGSVQKIFVLPSQKGALKLTIAKLSTPQGRSIQDVGITPDLIIEQSDNKESQEDAQLHHAVLVFKNAILMKEKF